jgi:hypothetical protein
MAMTLKKAGIQKTILQSIAADIDEFRDAIFRTSGRIKQVGTLGA